MSDNDSETLLLVNIQSLYTSTQSGNCSGAFAGSRERPRWGGSGGFRFRNAAVMEEMGSQGRGDVWKFL